MALFLLYPIGQKVRGPNQIQVIGEIIPPLNKGVTMVMPNAQDHVVEDSVAVISGEYNLSSKGSGMTLLGKDSITGKAVTESSVEESKFQKQKG
jgi:hypothetical protein